MNKIRIRLTESDIHRLVKESVTNILNDINEYEPSNDFVRGWQRQQAIKEKNLKLIEFLKKNVADENTKLSLSTYDSSIMLRQYIDADKYIDGTSNLTDNKQYLGYKKYKVWIRNTNNNSGWDGWDYIYVDREELRAKYPEVCKIFDECEKYIIQSNKS